MLEQIQSMYGLQHGVWGVGSGSVQWRALRLWHLCSWKEEVSGVRNRGENIGYFWKESPVRRDSAAISFLPFREMLTVFSYSSMRR